MKLSEKDFIEKILLLKEGDIVQSDAFNSLGDGFKQRIVTFNPNNEKYYFVGGTPYKPLLNTVSCLLGNEFEVLGNIKDNNNYLVGDLILKENIDNKELKPIKWFIDLCMSRYDIKETETIFNAFYNHFKKEYRSIDTDISTTLEEILNNYYLAD